MKLSINILLFLAIAAMAIATELSDTLTSAAVTVTMTEQVCVNGCAGDATPLSLASALATADNASAAVSLIASAMAGNHHGDIGAPQIVANTTTVTAVASATSCPAPPTFDLSLATVWSIMNGDLNGTTAASANANGTEGSAKRWSQGRNSLCFTDSSTVATGHYGIYLDGWGQEADGCGKGVLDNLRGQCGDVWFWGCKHWGSGVVLTFYLPGAWRATCALDGVWLASPSDNREEGLCCVYLGSSLITMHTC